MKKKYKIYYDLSTHGGVQTCVLALIKYLNNNGHIPLIYWDKRPSGKVVEDLKFDFVSLSFPVPSSFIKRLPHSLRFWLWVLNYKRIDDAHNLHFSFHPVISFASTTPSVTYVSGPPFLKYFRPGIAGQINNVLYSVIKRIVPIYTFLPNTKYICNSNFIQGLIFSEFDFKMDVLYPPTLMTKNGNTQKNIDVVYFGRIVQSKRVDKIIEMAIEFPNKKFLIMGGVNRENENYLETLKYSSKTLNNVEFLTNLSYQEAIENLSKSLVFLFPAIEEHFGIVTVEALYQGCIPLVHDSGGQREIVNFRELRFVDEDLKTKLSWILNNSNRARALSKKIDLSQYSGDSFSHNLVRNI